MMALLVVLKTVELSFMGHFGVHTVRPRSGHLESQPSIYRMSSVRHRMDKVSSPSVAKRACSLIQPGSTRTVRGKAEK
ncbi:MAG: hypothetical protein A3J84_04290 [Ignavibacteria bacterium RIFOXYA2_FULL_37_17]|nr:MAG: hypothetical protein A3J84_04290 [Ignavibacteria bacterium RIFOXYA2_FULL_37_17]